MAHEAAKELLSKARTPEDRRTAIREAMRQGMPLIEIEEFLDWLDATGRGMNEHEDSTPP